MTRRWLSLACARLEEACLGATSLNARFYRVDRACPAITLGFTTPCRDAAQIARLLKEKLTEIAPGFGIEALALEAGSTETLAFTQRSTLDDTPDYTVALNTLLNRLGPERLWRAAARENHIPEYAATPPTPPAPGAHHWQKQGFSLRPRAAISPVARRMSRTTASAGGFEVEDFWLIVATKERR